MGKFVMSMGNLVCLYMCRCMCRCVDMYMCMNNYDCFMYLHMCTYCSWMYVVTMHSAVGTRLLSNSAI